ncbi:MAG: type-F conjugative transfer system pilin assembly protein TrbC [Gammaproteobacteria bacterium HGW-Gammaproteobacteria-1]|jgi:conjugal transfer pilus assembly protein TrbC|nr:MAG: type-F conjugative transfer system pilin assembly protein TrbC [Gammaproteobacteria bacterium HGW-Gammaproteobacteria-1]
MLRQQLSLVFALCFLSPAFAGDAAVRAADLGRASAVAAEHQRNAGNAVEQALQAMTESKAVQEERARLGTVQPALLGSIDGVQPSPVGVDVNALLARYDELGMVSQADGEQLLVFISSSMPKASLRLLARQAAAVGAPLVLRGVTGESFPATAEFMREVYGDDELRARAMIDPTLFGRFDVRQAPAFVLVPSGACVAGVRNCPDSTPVHVHIAGDVTLDYALDYIARTRPEFRAAATHLLARLDARRDTKGAAQ